MENTEVADWKIALQITLLLLRCGGNGA